MSFQFTKWQGLGNDFVLVDCFKETITDCNQLAVAVCDRHFGIGADGLVTISSSAVADFHMRIFNSDGSEAEMCGNVTRCVARYVYENGLTAKTKISLETGAGIIRPELIFESGRVVNVRVDMGEPKLTRGVIPVTGQAKDTAIHIPVEANGVLYYGTCVSMGNPHCVIFTDDAAGIDLPLVGPGLEKHELFPKKINVEFVQVLNAENIRMRVWERGAGITLACGTGACAAVAASVLNQKTKRQVTVHLDGGKLFVEWGDNNHIFMTGPAIEVFRGEYRR
ncbi:diaminopimelate epimerase [Propionispora hippei]|uniref:Diaminopimelate epimerase n=1 Tax=Propionispora hippei DSM 15287 TaxID=1123003 RepID=A0A1M6AQS8_9FIRM|nr:diaminopimelate epimerase [Propionispora hippei]SHI38874.1 diaminopimelate epimerase [Propionispora hippei DSM 15287]